MPKTLLVTGGCLCGAIRFESQEPPFHVCYCHCGICRRSVGNIAGTWAFFPQASLKFINCQPTWFQSSETVSRGFCDKCGSPIAFSNTEYEHICIAHGALDKQEIYPPQQHWYLEDKLPFVDLQADLHNQCDLPDDPPKYPET
ncbi:MAG: GFA family protein [Rhizobiaceae bacterium]